MQSSTVIQWVEASWARVREVLVAVPELAGLGLLVAAGLAATLLVLAGAAFVRSLKGARRTVRAASIRRLDAPGARIVIVEGGGGRARRLSAFMAQALERGLKDFMLGGPFRLVPFPGAVEGDEAASAIMKRSEADLLIWTERQRGRRAVVRMMSRPANYETARPPITLTMPKDARHWTRELELAMCYAAAKQYRPALGRPQDFRAERLQPVVELLLSIVEAKPSADGKLLAEMIDDATAGALQLASVGEAGWVDRAVEIARGTLDGVSRASAPDRWVAAKIALGRGLRLQAEKQFDPVALRESITHLQEALEALRAEHRFKLAESAAAAIADAQRLLSGRRKFSITGGGV
jgi:hypothetical protein